MKKLMVSSLMLPRTGCFMLFFSLCLCSFSQNAGFSLTGKFTGFEEGAWFYLSNIDTQTILDSARLENGHISLSGELENIPEILYLSSGVAAEKKYTFLMIGNEQVHVQGDRSAFPARLEVNGSEFNLGRQAYYAYTGDWEMEANKWAKKFSQPKIKMKWDRKYAEAKDSLRARAWRYVQLHPNSHNSLYVLRDQLRDRSQEEIAEVFQKVSPEMKASHFATPIKVYLEKGVVKVGDPILDFKGQDSEGNEVSLSSFGEEYMLLSMMSSGCPISRASNEGLKELNQQQDSIQIVSYYVDRNKEKWLNSHKVSGGDWASIWDGKGAFGETYVRYGQPGFPTFFLIGPDKKILAKWTGYSVQGDTQYIVNKLKGYFNRK